MRDLLWSSYTLAMKVFPCKEKSLVGRHKMLGVRGKAGHKVINLDNSMHLGC